MRGSLASIGFTLFATSCGASSFVCQDDEQCIDGGAAGQCEPSGFCSFPSEDCPSGHRYGDRAGDGLAGECVVHDAGTSTGVGSSGDSITLDVTGSDPSDSSSAAPSTSSPGSAVSADTSSSMSTTGASCPPDWHDCSFAYRRRVSTTGLPNIAVEDFPVRVGLDRTFDWSHAADDGSDVRFFADAGTAYPHELEMWSVGVGAEIWLRLPTLGSDTDELAWMYYGSDRPPPPLDPADVWSNGYVAVWHMHDGEDSLGSYDLDATNTMVTNGRVGFAQEFDGATTRMANAEMPDPFTPGATITAWILPTGWGVNDLGRIADMRELSPFSAGWSFHVNGQDMPLHTLRFTELQGTPQYTATSPGDSIVLDEWQSVGLSYRHTEPVIDPVFYIDGLAVDTAIPVVGTAPAVDSSAPFTIGALAAAEDRFFDGIIDEFRISAEIRDEGWVAYEHASVASQLVELGEEETW